MSTSDEPLHFTGHLLRRAQQLHLAAWLRDVSRTTTSVQFAALSVLELRAPLSQQDLARELDLDRSTIADVVARMIEHGLISRHRDSADRRRNVLELTEAGKTRVTELRPRVEAIEPVLTAGLNPAEATELRRMLRAVLSHAVDSGLLSFETGQQLSH